MGFIEWWFHEHSMWSTFLTPEWSSIYSIYENNGWRFISCVLLFIVYGVIKVALKGDSKK